MSIKAGKAGTDGKEALRADATWTPTIGVIWSYVLQGRRKTVTTDPQRLTQAETEGQNGGASTAPPDKKPGGKKSASTHSASGQKSSTTGTAQAALAEERRKAAKAQAALEDMQRRLAAAEAALAEERREADEAQQAHAQQRQAVEAALAEERRKADEAQQALARQRQAPQTRPAAHQPTYLTWQQSLNAFINDADLDKKDADRARFVLSLFADTVAPSNTLLGNPAAMKKMYETGGASLVRGLTHMLEDLANNGGMPSQVNMKAFQVGKDLAISPGAVVFKNEVLELIQYQPTTPSVYRRPLLLVPPQVNKYYVMDLSPNKSLIRYLVANGVQVFAISWRNPTPEHREWGFETYDQAMLEAIDVVRAITASPDSNILGACLGGMTLSTLLGYLAAREDQRIHAVTFLVTVLDTHVESTMGLFATRETITAAREASRLKGGVAGQEMAA